MTFHSFWNTRSHFLFSPLRSRHRHKARQTKEKGRGLTCIAWLCVTDHLFPQNQRQAASSSVTQELSARFGEMLEAALKEARRALVLCPVCVAHRGLSTNQSVMGRSAVTSLLLSFAAVAFSARVKQTLQQFMNAALESGRDKGAFPHFVSRGPGPETASQRAAETSSSSRRRSCFPPLRTR